MTPTPEQTEILTAATSTSNNLLLVARAGAAKTTTLEFIARALPEESILCLAFNREIAKEMQRRLPANCEAKTLHSLAYGALRDYLGIRKRLNISTYKNFEILKELNCPREDFGRMLKAMSWAKSQGWIPDYTPSLLTEDEFFDSLEEEVTERDFLRTALRKSWDSLREVMDFDDQLLGATLLNCSFRRYSLVLVDEAQDLSALNHRMLEKILWRGDRLIAVGDPLQAIYAFRGAERRSMSIMQERFQMQKHSLTVSFRCPRSVVDSVRDLAPDMSYPENASEGSIIQQGPWNSDTVEEDTVVLCRFNAPLFSLNAKLLKAGRYPEFVGHDVLKGMENILKGFGGGLSQEQGLRAVDRWLEKRLRKSRNPAGVEDQADALRVIITQGETVQGALSFLGRMKRQKGRIKLMTIHKAKGKEFKTVYLLDADRIGEDGQEPNIRYVGVTRTKERLVYLQSGDFRG